MTRPHNELIKTPAALSAQPAVESRRSGSIAAIKAGEEAAQRRVNCQ